MSEKILETRIQNKYDTWENWKTVWYTFVPKKGETCVIEIPPNTLVEGFSTSATTQRYAKVGNGTATIANLAWLTTPFGVANAYEQTPKTLSQSDLVIECVVGIQRTPGNNGEGAIQPITKRFTLPAETQISIDKTTGSAITLTNSNKLKVVTQISKGDTTHNIDYTEQEISIPNETTLSKGTDTSDTAQTLSFGGTFTAMVDTSVSGHIITDKNRSFTLPARPTAVKQDVTGDSNYKPIVLGTQAIDGSTGTVSNQDGQVYVAQDFAYNPNKKTLAMNNALIGNTAHIKYDSDEKCLNFVFD